MRNRGELAEGWYEPSTLQKAIASSAEQEGEPLDQNFRDEQSERSSRDAHRQEKRKDFSHNSDSDSGGSIGPTLPGKGSRPGGWQVGPRMPNMQDLELKRGIHHFRRLLTLLGFPLTT